MTFEIGGQILKITLPQKNSRRIKTPSSKLMILVSSCWEKNFMHNNAHNFHSVPRFLEIIDRKCCILSGPPYITATALASLNLEWPRHLEQFIVSLKHLWSGPDPHLHSNVVHEWTTYDPPCVIIVWLFLLLGSWNLLLNSNNFWAIQTNIRMVWVSNKIMVVIFMTW